MRNRSVALLERGFPIDSKPLTTIVVPTTKARPACNRPFVPSYNGGGTRTQEGITTNAFTRNDWVELCACDMLSAAFTFPP